MTNLANNLKGEYSIKGILKQEGNGDYFGSRSNCEEWEIGDGG
jgi:hypothetical protein